MTATGLYPEQMSKGFGGSYRYRGMRNEVSSPESVPGSISDCHRPVPRTDVGKVKGCMCGWMGEGNSHSPRGCETRRPYFGIP